MLSHLFHARLHRIWHSVITRVIVRGVVVVFLGSALKVGILSRYLQEDLESIALQRQTEIANGKAQQLSADVMLRQKLLDGLAAVAPDDVRQGAVLPQAWLEAHKDMLNVFSLGLSFQSGSGQVVELGLPDGNHFVPAAGRTGSGVQVGHVGDVVAVSFSTPLVPAHPERGVLRGFSPIVPEVPPTDADTVPATDGGGVAVVVPQAKLFVALSGNPSRRASLQSLHLAAFNPVLDLGLAKPGGAVIANNAQGVPEVDAFRRIAPLDWYVVAHVPASVAFVHSSHFHQFVLQTVPAIAVLYLFFVSLGLYYVLKPLLQAARHADRMTRGEIPLEPLPIAYPDELGDLTAAFNRLLESLISKTRELTEQKELAHSAVLAKSRFLASASHDLRQPMHALHLYLGTLAMAPMPPPTARLVAQIRQCADSMDDMFSSLLDISKLDADAMQAMQHVFAMDELLDMVQSEFTSQAARKGLSLHVRPCPALVSCDRDMLLRILRNLVSNAVRYTDKGRIMVACRRRGTDLVIGVFDTGMGIAPDQQSKVFEEFYQVKRPKLRDPAQGPGQALGQGLGLGLAIVQRLAHLMKTTVRLRSVLDKGSQFSIAVPLVSVKDRRQQARSEFSARPDLRSLVGIFVVVVDDDERVLDATRTLLEGWGCTVVAATSGHALISQLANSQRPPDAMVCDFQLEGHETGVDVISTVRDEFNQDIAALIVTGDTTPDQLSSIANTGLKILHKPLQAHLLKEALCELTHQAVAHSQA